MTTPKLQPLPTTEPKTELPYADPADAENQASAADPLHELLTIAEESLPPAIASVFAAFDRAVEEELITIDEYKLSSCGRFYNMVLNGIISVQVPARMWAANPDTGTAHTRFLAMLLASLDDLEEWLELDGVVKIRRCVICGLTCCNIGPFDFITMRMEGV